jgi:hypothetical protein
LGESKTSSVTTFDSAIDPEERGDCVNIATRLRHFGERLQF